MGEVLIADKLQNEGTGRVICRDLGLNMEDWALDITAYDWGVRVNKRKHNHHEELLIHNYDGKGGLFDGTVFVKSNEGLVMYKNMRDYRRGVRM